VPSGTNVYKRSTTRLKNNSEFSLSSFLWRCRREDPYWRSGAVHRIKAKQRGGFVDAQNHFFKRYVGYKRQEFCGGFAARTKSEAPRSRRLRSEERSRDKTASFTSNTVPVTYGTLLYLMGPPPQNKGEASRPQWNPKTMSTPMR
jgi:hypothetical protein